MLTYLSLGSNLGNKEDNLTKAVSLISEKVGKVVRRSSFYYSEPWGFQSENSFVNLCIAVETSLAPLDLLHSTQLIERTMGRTRKSKDGLYHDRIIDIDILLYGDQHISLPELQIPHPLMTRRDFVMIPLREIMDTGQQE